MDAQLVNALAGRLGGKTRIEGATLHSIVQHGDAWLATRVRTEPVAEIFVATRPLDGFELAIKWGDRWFDPNVGDKTFDDRFSLATNDEVLMRAWLDPLARDALLASAYSYEAEGVTGFLTGEMERRYRTWSYDLANDELIVTKGSREVNVDAFMIAITTALTVAARSQRWANEYAAIARKLGGKAASEVEIGGGPVISATRSSIDVTMRVVRRTGAVEKLRTVVSAPRVGDPNLAKEKPLDELAKKLNAIAKPRSIEFDTDSVDLWWDGALSAYEQIDTAIALAAHLAVDAVAAQGPYR